MPQQHFNALQFEETIPEQPSLTDTGDFVWGVASSSYQTEGASTHEGKGPSIWDTFVEKKGKILFNHTAKEATNFFHLYKDDIQLLKAMGIGNFRFSISWPRVIPDGKGIINIKGLDFYDRLVDELLLHDITPWITLYHWDLPHALESKGGWTNREIITWFSRYAEVVVKRLGDRVKNWMVLNEPVVYTGAGYFLGVHAPGRKGMENFIPAVHHTAIVQAEGIRLIKSLYPDSNVGTTFSCSYITPYRNIEKDILAANRVDALLNRLYVEPLLGLGYPLKTLPMLQRIDKYFKAGDEKRIACNPDFIGIQNYTREVVRHSWITPYLKARLVNAKTRNVERTVMNWEVYPDSLYHMLMQYSAYPQLKKILVTENGAAFPDQLIDDEVHDPKRREFIQSCIHSMLKAKAAGAKVHGYFAWSFTDNFEWTEGFVPRFGLVYVDYKTQKRIVKSSGLWYGKFVSEKNLAGKK
ncbi:GH1 family beta-glucosidase [soil metagenome]